LNWLASSVFCSENATLTTFRQASIPLVCAFYFLFLAKFLADATAYINIILAGI
jgi:hypothetical protein